MKVDTGASASPTPAPAAATLATIVARLGGDTLTLGERLVEGYPRPLHVYTADGASAAINDAMLSVLGSSVRHEEVIGL
jgi:hypothetical protein